MAASLQMEKVWSWVEFLDSYSVIYYLCDIGHIIQLLCFLKNGLQNLP